MKREDFTADHLRDALPADPNLPDEFDRLLAAIDSGDARASFIEQLADEELDRLKALTDWARHELGEVRDNPLFDPQPDYCSDLDRPGLSAADVSRMYGEGDADVRERIDEMLDRQRAEMVDQQRRWQEDWMC